jgi:drug/metabolite transporter (DMT)-like permease
MRRAAIVFALLAAALFGASTPLAKALIGEVAPLVLAGLLYLGSGIGLVVWLFFRTLFRMPREEAMLRMPDLPWLAGSVIAGGIAGPALFMFGLAATDAASASLLLNLEAVFTAALAWIAFRENVDTRVFLGMLAIVAGGVVLSWPQSLERGSLTGPLLIAAACLAWALDNNLTRRISGGDPVVIAAAKGLCAGAATLALGLAYGGALPGVAISAAAGAVGLVGYGISLVLFILALRDLGAARTGAYFSVAPFFGAALALALFGAPASLAFWVAGALMALGAWLHLTERHEHDHVHEATEHEHSHAHDEHHRHDHGLAWDGREPHSHPHRHERLAHRHPHYPDTHHRHAH